LWKIKSFLSRLEYFVQPKIDQKSIALFSIISFLAKKVDVSS